MTGSIYWFGYTLFEKVSEIQRLTDRRVQTFALAKGNLFSASTKRAAQKSADDWRIINQNSPMRKSAAFLCAEAGN
jgi:hypothetical protein